MSSIWVEELMSWIISNYMKKKLLSELKSLNFYGKFKGEIHNGRIGSNILMHQPK